MLPCGYNRYILHKNPRLNMTYETGVFDMAALIKKADLLVSIDTSLIHIADAVGTKVVEIYSQNTPYNAPCFPKLTEYKAVKQTLNDEFSILMGLEKATSLKR